MLFLTRRRGEAVDLTFRETGEVIATVSVVELLPNGVVRLGFNAPAHVKIVRDNIVNNEPPDNGDGA